MNEAFKSLEFIEHIKFVDAPVEVVDERHKPLFQKFDFI